MKKGLLVLVFVIVMCSFVSAEISESDEGYNWQAFFPGYIEVDDYTYQDRCQLYERTDGGGSYYLGTEPGEAYQARLEAESEHFYTIDGEFENGEWKEYYLKEYCSSYEVCAGYDEEVETHGSGDNEVYSVQIYCQYGCAHVEDGPDFCISQTEYREAFEGVEAVDPILGCAEDDDGLLRYSPAYSKHVNIIHTYEFTDTCDEGVLREACCGSGCGDWEVSSKLEVANRECPGGCVYVPEGADFCAKEDWDNCDYDLQCASGYECVDGDCERREVVAIKSCSTFGCDCDGDEYLDYESTKDVAQYYNACLDGDYCSSGSGTWYASGSDSDYWTGYCAKGLEGEEEVECAFFGCDCDNDGALSDEEHYFSKGDSVSALSSALCNAEPGTSVSGYDAWCGTKVGLWYDSVVESEGECAPEVVDDDPGTYTTGVTRFSRAPTKGFFGEFFSRVKAFF